LPPTPPFSHINSARPQNPKKPISPNPRRQEAYAAWFPEDVTFQPKLVASQRPPGSLGAGPNAGLPLVERLYASYEKARGLGAVGVVESR
jgi:hypothetical protein